MALSELERLREENKKRAAAGIPEGNIPSSLVEEINKPKKSRTDVQKTLERIQNASPKESIEATKPVLDVVVEEKRLAGELNNKQAQKVKENLNNPQKMEELTNKPDGKLSVSDNFTKAMTFFAPQILGGLAGALFEGTEGAIAGIEEGGKARDAFIAYNQSEKELALKEQSELRKGSPDPMELQRLQQAEQRLEMQKANLELDKQRNKDLNVDRELRREERDLNRAISAKQAFAKKPEVVKLKEGLSVLNEMEDIITQAPEIAVGTIPAKIARGIAGEVGVLTDKDIERANISPSFIRNLKRGGARFLTGQLPEQDVQDLQKVINAIRSSKKIQLRKNVESFSKARSKDFRPNIQKDFLSDLMIEHGLEESRPSTPTEKDIDSMSKEELEAYLAR